MDAGNRQLSPFRAAPNLLTLLRICMMPFLVASILEDQYYWSFALFLIAGLTDALDGAVARIFEQSTVLGQYLDPVADKLLLSTLFLVFTSKGLIPTYVTALVFGRDLGILVVAALLYAAAGRRDFAPSFWGKANTTAQITAVAAVMLHQLTGALWVTWVRNAMLEATVALTVLSGLHYAWVAARRSSAANGHAADKG